jgi:hypothetical protein
LVATILLSFILVFHFCFLMRDPQWLYTWDSKEGMGGLDRISSLFETWGGGRFNFNSSDSGSPLRVSLEDQDRQKLEVL